MPAAEDITVLIPAAGPAPEGFLTISNIGSPAMVSVAGRPLVYWTLTYLRSLGLRRFVIGVAHRGMFIEDFVASTVDGECDVRFVAIARPGRRRGDRSVVHTLQALSEAVTTPSALVVLGDTHFQFDGRDPLSTHEPFVLTGPVNESDRWCTIDHDNSEAVTDFFDKVPGRALPLEALIGVYFFPDAEVFRTATRSAIAEVTERRCEISDVLRRVGAQSPIRARSAGFWLDCGNPDMLANAHWTVLQRREFNELSVDPVLGTITKRSRHVGKFIDEINYYRLVPRDLEVLFPRMLEYSVDWHDPWATFEYYGYPTLAEVFVFENVHLSVWEQIFLRLREILVSRLAPHRRPLADGVIHSMYIHKTRQRLHEMQAPDELRALIDREGWVRVNGERLPNLPLLWPAIEAEVKSMEGDSDGCLIHGDLCFSNILYDLRVHLCKLVDPRGSFGQMGVYGDPRYDVAKLHQCAVGQYDFITNDLFRVSIQGDDIRLAIRARSQHEQIGRQFQKVFFGMFDERRITLITGLLFASMIALHYDHPSRQIAMYATALKMLQRALDVRG